MGIFGGKLIGRAVVEVTSDNSKLEAGLSQAEARVEKSAQKMDGAFSQATSGSDKFAASLSKILVPVAVIAAVDSLVKKFRDLVVQGRAFSAEMDAAGKSLSRTNQALLADLRGRSDLEKQIIQAQQEQADRVDALVLKQQNLITQTSLLREAQLEAANRANDEVMTLRETLDLIDDQITASEKALQQRIKLLRLLDEQKKKEEEATKEKQRQLDIEKERARVATETASAFEQLANQAQGVFGETGTVGALNEIAQQLARQQAGDSSL